MSILAISVVDEIKERPEKKLSKRGRVYFGSHFRGYSSLWWRKNE